MNIQAFSDAPFADQFHLVTVSIAIGLTVAILVLKKGTPLHRTLGRIWVILIGATALSTFAIHGLNPPNGFSWLHGLSIFTLISLLLGVRAARRGNIRAHKGAMLGIVFGGLIIAGGFAIFTPGRLTYTILFGG